MSRGAGKRQHIQLCPIALWMSLPHFAGRGQPIPPSARSLHNAKTPPKPVRLHRRATSTSQTLGDQEQQPRNATAAKTTNAPRRNASQGHTSNMTTHSTNRAGALGAGSRRHSTSGRERKQSRPTERANMVRPSIGHTVMFTGGGLRCEAMR